MLKKMLDTVLRNGIIVIRMIEELFGIHRKDTMEVLGRLLVVASSGLASNIYS